MITMHTCPKQTDEQTDEHHGNSTTIRSNERIARYKYRKCSKSVTAHVLLQSVILKTRIL